MTNPNRITFSKEQSEYWGCELLNLLIAFDTRLEYKEEEETAYHKAVQSNPRCPSKLYMTLKEVIEEQKGILEYTITIDKLIPGMILARDVNMNNGTMLMTKETEFNINLIDILKRLNLHEVCGDDVSVYNNAK